MADDLMYASLADKIRGMWVVLVQWTKNVAGLTVPQSDSRFSNFE